jgi:hypothetical protein
MEEDLQTIEIKEDIKNSPIKQRCIYKSWYWIEKFFDNPKIKCKDKAYLAVKVATKDMPTDLEGSLNVNVTLADLLRNAEQFRRVTPSVN